jgi:hypothetical protein
VSERFRVLLLLVALVGLLGAAAPVPDPTRPAIAPRVAMDETAPVAALVLQSTIVSPQQRSAIINGKRYRAGDAVGDARLEAIGPGWVRLRGPTGSTELRLSFSNSTRPVNR